MVGTSSMQDSRAALRQYMRKQRLLLCNTDQHVAAEKLRQHCVPLLRTAKSIAGYRAVNGEICISRLLADCRHQGSTTLLPLITDNKLVFAPFTEQTRMVKKRYGILTPDTSPDACISPENIDVVLVPLVAFDTDCNRLGMGGGYYDRSFAMRRQGAAPPLLIGVAYALQQAESVFADWWDVPLDVIVTDAGVIHNTRD